MKGMGVVSDDPDGFRDTPPGRPLPSEFILRPSIFKGKALEQEREPIQDMGTLTNCGTGCDVAEREIGGERVTSAGFWASFFMSEETEKDEFKFSGCLSV